MGLGYRTLQNNPGQVHVGALLYKFLYCSPCTTIFNGKSWGVGVGGGGSPGLPPVRNPTTAYKTITHEDVVIACFTWLNLVNSLQALPVYCNKIDNGLLTV